MKTQAEETVRAFEVCVGLLHAADYMRTWMKAPLEAFDLTKGIFVCREAVSP